MHSCGPRPAASPGPKTRAGRGSAIPRDITEGSCVLAAGKCFGYWKNIRDNMGPKPCCHDSPSRRREELSSRLVRRAELGAQRQPAVTRSGRLEQQRCQHQAHLTARCSRQNEIAPVPVVSGLHGRIEQRGLGQAGPPPPCFWRHRPYIVAQRNRPCTQAAVSSAVVRRCMVRVIGGRNPAWAVILRAGAAGTAQRYGARVPIARTRQRAGQHHPDHQSRAEALHHSKNVSGRNTHLPYSICWYRRKQRAGMAFLQASPGRIPFRGASQDTDPIPCPRGRGVCAMALKTLSAH